MTQNAQQHFTRRPRRSADPLFSKCENLLWNDNDCAEYSGPPPLVPPQSPRFRTNKGINRCGVLQNSPCSFLRSQPRRFLRTPPSSVAAGDHHHQHHRATRTGDTRQRSPVWDPACVLRDGQSRVGWKYTGGQGSVGFKVEKREILAVEALETFTHLEESGKMRNDISTRCYRVEEMLQLKQLLRKPQPQKNIQLAPLNTTRLTLRGCVLFATKRQRRVRKRVFFMCKAGGIVPVSLLETKSCLDCVRT